jgi:hypothetical protein
MYKISQLNKRQNIFYRLEHSIWFSAYVTLEYIQLSVDNLTPKAIT